MRSERICQVNSEVAGKQINNACESQFFSLVALTSDIVTMVCLFLWYGLLPFVVPFYKGIFSCAYAWEDWICSSDGWGCVSSAQKKGIVAPQ